LKLIFSGYISITDKSETDAVGVGFNKLLWLIVNSKKIIILVILYTIANILSYYALARVEAATYTVLLQLKIFTTAAFAVLMLGRNISSSKWRALLLLVLGCILVASPAYNQPKDCSLKVDTENDYDNPRSLLTSCLGIFSILIMVAISGFSAIYFEQMLKQQGTKVTIWERNFQLAFYSIIFLIAIVTWEKVNYNEDMDFNIGEGWTINTFLIAIIQAGGGLLVAATLKYADAILKTLATSGAIVISTLIGYFLLNGVLDIFVIIGSVSTILAIFNYTLE
jgi:UDP-sugar transporter A1/2/3